MKTNGSFTKSTVLCLVVALAATSAFARTVYDAGAALHANITSASPVGADGATYTDAQGGKWQYLRANDREATTTTSFGKSITSGTYYRGIGGTNPRAGSPYIHVNVSGAATTDGVTNGEPVDADEFYAHPGNPGSANHYVVIRFIVPEDGWYSAFLTAHDLNKQGSANKNSGAEVSLVANNVLQARGVVSLEDYDETDNTSRYLLTHRFDFQMPVRWMAAGETLDFVIGANGAHDSDATGLKAFVTKEDEGAFYDSGRALNENVSGSSLNPFGTTSLGMWYCCYADTTDPKTNSSSSTAASADAFATWAPSRYTKKLTVLDSSATRTAAPLLKGFFMSDRIGSSPFICVNQTDANTGDVAPRELYAHPHAGNWTNWSALRFRPPRGGLYSGSVVLRDVNRNVATDSDGVMVYLLVAEKAVTNAVISAETFNATAHFTFDARFLAANEPIDIVISPHNGHASDATTISAIFRREADAYDAGYSMAALDWANATRPAHPFADVFGGGATWDVGTSTALSGTPFTTMPYAFKKVNNNVDYFGYGSASDGGLPRVMISTNGVAQLYNSTDAKKYRMSPCELWAHPNSSAPNFGVVRAKVPADGVYRARAYARKIAQSADGVRMNLSVAGCISESKAINGGDTTLPYEAAVNGDCLWLKAGDAIDAVIDPNGGNAGDATCLSVCYVKDGDVAATKRVINVHFTERGTGKLSPTTQRPREGWSDWNKWNAFRAGDVASAEIKNCYEADGTARRNVTVALMRDSGTAITKGSSTDALFYSYVLSDGTADTYTFTIGDLKKNEPYTLYLYSVKSSSDLGNATFAVGGVTKGVDEAWDVNGRKVLTRFEVTSDANGEITGTFAAADANGGVFNGLTIVGEFPEYVPTGAMVIIR